jgi:myo-inositol 2-dehydrogenase / D-chiro-inositol 1-dehydrogenase
VAAIEPVKSLVTHGISPSGRPAGEVRRGADDGHRRTRQETSSVTVRVGLVGAGAVGARHARTLTGFDDVELVGVCDPEPAGRVLAEQLGVPVVADLEALLRSGLDGVWLCVPPFAHGDLERTLVQAGVPFFVEKPLAADLAVAEGVAAAVSAAGLPTATGYHWRHLDTVARAREVLAGVPVRLVAARWWGATPPAAWWGRQALSGGQVVEQATHVLDLLRVLAGEVDEVVGAAAPSSAGNRDVADATGAVLRFGSGAVGTVSTSCVLPGATDAALDVLGGGVAVHLTETSLQLRTAEGEEQRQPAVDARRAVDRAFVDVLAGHPAPAELVTVGEALQTHRLGWAVAEATRDGGVVGVPGR